MISAAASGQEGHRVDSWARGLSRWSLHVLPLGVGSVQVLLPQPEEHWAN